MKCEASEDYLSDRNMLGRLYEYESMFNCLIALRVTVYLLTPSYNALFVCKHHHICLQSIPNMLRPTCDIIQELRAIRSV